MQKPLSTCFWMPHIDNGAMQDCINDCREDWTGVGVYCPMTPEWHQTMARFLKDAGGGSICVSLTSCIGHLLVEINVMPLKLPVTKNWQCSFSQSTRSASHKMIGFLMSYQAYVKGTCNHEDSGAEPSRRFWKYIQCFKNKLGPVGISFIF